MEIIGIIAEYNPFHNGHIYHIDKIKKMYPNSIIILILSGYFSERGEISILTKRQKTIIALENNIDLVIELPFEFATQSADIFAKGSLSLLNHLKVNKLVFGSESNEIIELINLAKTQINNQEYDKLVKKYLQEGLNYPTALSNSLKDLTGTTTNTPNDLLAISYIKEIIKNNYQITPITIKRTTNYHETNSTEKITSASNIRNLIKENKDYSNTVPKITHDFITLNSINYEKYFQLLKYKIITDNDLSRYQTVDEGLENRLKKVIDNCNTLDELITSIKTKRYTYNKLNRMLLHILISLTKERAKEQEIKYLRILGFTEKGRSYLNKIKKDLTIPLITKVNKNNYELLKLELTVSKFYQLLSNQNTTKDDLEKPVQK